MKRKVENESEYLSDDGHLIINDSEDDEEEKDANNKLTDDTEDVDIG